MPSPLLKRMFSEKFLSRPRYVLERDRPLPHELQAKKPCTRCGTVLTNNFQNFQKIPFGDRKLNRHTTGDMCNSCREQSIRNGMKAIGAANSAAEDAMMDDALKGLKPLDGLKKG